MYNNPLRYTDSSGHCIDGISTAVCIAIALFIIDKAWTAFDIGVSMGVLADPNASEEAKLLAAVNIAISVLFEVVEPDEILAGLGLPVDDIARKVIMKLAGDAFEEGGEAGLRAFLRKVFGDNADTVLNKVDELVGAICSFSEDTLVMTEDGPVPISELEVGDIVLAYNEATGEIGYYPIAATWLHTDTEIVFLTIDGEVIETTPEHPFYTDEGEWVAAGLLEVGDKIQTAEGGYGVVETIETLSLVQPMYNLTVDEVHTFFVGQGEWLVHNTCTVEDLMAAGSSPSGKGQLTEFGRALKKHSDRAGDAWAPFAPSGRSDKSFNEMAAQLVWDILNDPNTVIRKHSTANFGDVVDYLTPDGRGVRYDAYGNFIGFINAQIRNK